MNRRKKIFARQKSQFKDDDLNPRLSLTLGMPALNGLSVPTDTAQLLVRAYVKSVS